MLSIAPNAGERKGRNRPSSIAIKLVVKNIVTIGEITREAIIPIGMIVPKSERLMGAVAV